MKDRYFGFRGGWLTFWMTVACATDMTLFGYDQGVFGGVVVTQDFLVVHNLEDNASLLATTAAIYNIGCFFGAISAFILGDILGRKKAILLGTTVMSIGAILQITSYSVSQMIVGRIVCGLGNGMNTSTAPPWQAETSKASWRGRLIVIEMIMNIAGFSLSNWVTYGFSFIPGGVAWRVPLAMQFIFIFILYATVPWLPESPRLLVKKGHFDKAEQILADVEGTEIEDPYVQIELNEIKFAAQYEKENALRVRDLLRGRVPPNDPCTLRRLLLGMGTQAMQQLSGINVTSYYLPTVLIESVGLENRMARLLAACNSVSYLLFSLIGIPNIERWGRRQMIIFAASGQCFCYIFITVLLRFTEKPGYPNQEAVASASVAFFFLYYVFFGIGFQGTPWLYPTEVNGLAMRSKGAAMGTATNWIFNFMVVEITPIGIQNLGWRFYIIWTVLNGCFVPFTYFLYPETAARTLEDIDHYFREQPSIFAFKDKRVTSSKRPAEFVEREEEEVRRKSSVDAHAAELAHRHRRYSQMSVQGRGSTADTNDSGNEKEPLSYKEDV